MDIVRNILIHKFALDITNIIIDELSVNIWKNRFNQSLLDILNIECTYTTSDFSQNVFHNIIFGNDSPFRRRLSYYVLFQDDICFGSIAFDCNNREHFQNWNGNGNWMRNWIGPINIWSK
jgi:hypothetical protein